MILLVGPLPDPIDGCSFANQRLLEGLINEGYRVDSINTNTKFISAQQGSSFSIRKVFFFVKSYFLMYKIFFAKKIYATPGQTFYGVMKYSPFLFFAWLLRKPYFIHLHGNYLGREYSNLSRLKKVLFSKVISNASGGIVLSNSLKSNFYGLLPDEKVFVVHNFVEEKILEEFRQGKSKPKDKLRILFLSNMIQEKGILEVLKACIILHDRGIDFKLTVAGGFDETIRGSVISLFDTLGSSVNYLGVVSGTEKVTAFLDSNVFVLPTYYMMEGQPISLLEGLAAGDIVVTTPHAGIPDIITTENGFIVEPKSPESLFKAFEDISKNLTKNIDQFSKKNFEYANSTFVEQVFIQSIINVMQSC